MRELQNLDGGKQVQKSKKGKSSETGSSKGAVSVSYRVFFTICILFLLLPVIIFCLGYLRPLIGLALAVALPVSLYIVSCEFSSKTQNANRS